MSGRWGWTRSLAFGTGDGRPIAGQECGCPIHARLLRMSGDQFTPALRWTRARCPGLASETWESTNPIQSQEAGSRERAAEHRCQPLSSDLFSNPLIPNARFLSAFCILIPAKAHNRDNHAHGLIHFAPSTRPDPAQGMRPVDSVGVRPVCTEKINTPPPPPTFFHRKRALF